MYGWTISGILLIATWLHTSVLLCRGLSVRQLPSCANDCFGASVSKEGCSQNDVNCFCAKSDLAQVVAACVSTGCSSNRDQQAGVDFVSGVCSAAGYSWPNDNAASAILSSASIRRSEGIAQPSRTRTTTITTATVVVTVTVFPTGDAAGQGSGPTVTTTSYTSTETLTLTLTGNGAKAFLPRLLSAVCMLTAILLYRPMLW